MWFIILVCLIIHFYLCYLMNEWQNWQLWHDILQYYSVIKFHTAKWLILSFNGIVVNVYLKDISRAQFKEVLKDTGSLLGHFKTNLGMQLEVCEKPQMGSNKKYLVIFSLDIYTSFKDKKVIISCEIVI